MYILELEHYFFTHNFDKTNLAMKYKRLVAIVTNVSHICRQFYSSFDFRAQSADQHGFSVSAILRLQCMLFCFLLQLS